MARGAAAAWRPWVWSTGLHGLLLAALASGVVLTQLEPPADTALALEAVVVDAATLAALQRATMPQPRPAPSPPPSEAPPPQAAPPEAVVQPATAPQPTPAPTPKPTPTAKPAPTAKVPPPPAADKKDKKPAPVAPTPTPTPPPPTVDPARAAAEAELQAQLAEEARLGTLRASGLGARWSAAIRARIERAWIRPETARPGIDCTVAVTQAPGGTVLRVAVRACNGDEAVRQSIEDAVMRASPLPPPPDPALFERELILRFRPDA